MSQKIAITVAHGDGIGPEIMEASLHIIQSAAGIEDQLSPEFMECRKLSSRSGCEKVVRFASKYAAVAEHKGWTREVARSPKKVDLVGVDMFCSADGRGAKEFGDALSKVTNEGLALSMMSNRGTAVSPDSLAETFLIDAFQCRFTPAGGNIATQGQIIGLMQKVAAAGYDNVRTETLLNFEGVRGYTLAQGQ